MANEIDEKELRQKSFRMSWICLVESEMPVEEWSLAHLFIGSENRIKINGLQVQQEELR